MRIGILGGSFNPIHNGHLAMARAALRAHRLDRVIFIPAGRPPHKHDELAPAEDRWRLVQLAIAGDPAFSASDIELRREGKSYTVDTLEAIRAEHPGDELFFILGEDSLTDLPRWREPGRILSLARIVTLNRPGHRAAIRASDYPGVPPALLEQVERDRVVMPESLIESRRLRAVLARGGSVEGLVPDGVAAYLQERRLYSSG